MEKGLEGSNSEFRKINWETKGDGGSLKEGCIDSVDGVKMQRYNWMNYNAFSEGTMFW